MPRTGFSQRATIRRRRLTAVGVAVVAAAGAVAAARGSITGHQRMPAVVTLVVADRPPVELPAGRRSGSRGLDEADLGRRIRQSVPASVTVRRGRARISYRLDLAETVRRARRQAASGGRVKVALRARSAVVPAPALRQAQANTCESAARSILLGSLGQRVDQGRLQQALPVSGPLDPVGEGPARVWGDPDLGYVGRPDGDGPAGGFGVYPGPVRDTALRYGTRLRTLTGRRPQSVYRALLEGRAVMAWVGLSDGPYGQWRTPTGRRVTVNFGEHTVVLHGIRGDGRLLVSNPLRGTREAWSRADFELMWQRLGRRALAT